MDESIGVHLVRLGVVTVPHHAVGDPQSTRTVEDVGVAVHAKIVENVLGKTVESVRVAVHALTVENVHEKTVENGLAGTVENVCEGIVRNGHLKEAHAKTAGSARPKRKKSANRTIAAMVCQILVHQNNVSVVENDPSPTIDVRALIDDGQDHGIRMEDVNVRIRGHLLAVAREGEMKEEHLIDPTHKTSILTNLYTQTEYPLNDTCMHSY
jgi:hypothetical protein